MKKAELLAAIAEKNGSTKKNAEAALDAVISTITEALEKGDSVAIQSFGTFEVRERAARTGVNPQTHQPIEINASKAPAFKVSYKLKERINK